MHAKRAVPVICAWLVGCGEVTHVSLFPFPLCTPLAIGDSIYVVANAERANWPVVAYSSITQPEAFNWRSSDDGVATVSPAGVVHARAPGTVTISATAERLTGTARITTAVAKSRATVSPTRLTLKPGDTVGLVLKAWDSTGAPIALQNGQSLVDSDGDARFFLVWDDRPDLARLVGLQKGAGHVSWRVGSRCGATQVIVE